ncbi:hypothetical protein CFOL_v3_34556 [Cephalotus follicularis]|uniref:Uncharacterized protein n=1 Tax=Cephalotus follicularis TaxID=3775 RepID=A0A1Q3DF98_CEPFO|nr:hypothetical protein CFOL_v3_34556 [Cephalotus follicularis]
MIISFSDDDLNGIKIPHEDPLVVTVQIANHLVKRVLVDNRSSTNILSLNAFNQMNFSQSNLTAIQSPLDGFTGDTLNSKGVISLSHHLSKFPCRQNATNIQFHPWTTIPSNPQGSSLYPTFEDEISHP